MIIFMALISWPILILTLKVMSYGPLFKKNPHMTFCFALLHFKQTSSNFMSMFMAMISRTGSIITDIHPLCKELWPFDIQKIP